jgi:hypothetical protein
MTTYFQNLHIAGSIMQSEDRSVPLRSVIFVTCVSGALAAEVLNLPPRFVFAAVFAALMTVCPDIWVSLPKSPQDELEEARREIAALKQAKLEALEKKVAALEADA